MEANKKDTTWEEPEINDWAEPTYIKDGLKDKIKETYTFKYAPLTPNSLSEFMDNINNQTRLYNQDIGISVPFPTNVNLDQVINDINRRSLIVNSTPDSTSTSLNSYRRPWFNSPF